LDNGEGCGGGEVAFGLRGCPLGCGLAKSGQRFLECLGFGLKGWF